MSTTRRSFFKQVAALGATGLIAPSIMGGSRLFAAEGAPNKPQPRQIPSSEKVNLACVGIGNRGGEIIRMFAGSGQANIVALCDVNMGAGHTKGIMDMFPDAPRFQDFRVMIEEMGDKIDAVCVGTPDHSHFPILMHCMMHGKHVFSEKPLAHTFQENALLIKAAKANPQLVTQMGNQGHSEANFYQFKTWVEKGIIKDVTAITAHMNSARRWHGWDPSKAGFPAAEPIPATMAWDIWPCACMPRVYSTKYDYGNWRCWYDFGMGALGDWGAHILDTAHRFLDLGLPYEIDPVKLTGHNDFFFPMSSTIVFRFPERGDMPPCDVTWYDGVDNIPDVPEGYGVSELDPNIPPTSQGAIKPVALNPGKIIYSKELTFKGGTHGSTLSIIPESKAKEMEASLPAYPKTPCNHYKNFLLACKGEMEPQSPFEISAPLSQMFCLGVLAQRLGTKLCFDRETQRITNNQVADALLCPPPRPGWEEYYNI